MKWDRSCQLMSFPPQYQGKCADCRAGASATCDKVDSALSTDKSE